MGKYFRQLFLRLSGPVILIVLTGQSIHNTPRADSSLQVHHTLQERFTKRLDSIQQTGDLAEWLYSWREYVEEDPFHRVSLLAIARSGAWRSCKTDAERTAWISSLAAEGYYFLRGGNILRSIEAYEQAYRFYFDRPFPGFNLLEYVLKPLGNNYTRLGDYDRAFLIQEKSLAMARQQDSMQVASVYHNLTTTAIWKDDLSLAEQYCKNGLKVVKKNSALHGLLLATLGDLLLRARNYVDAEASGHEAIRILESQKEEGAGSNLPDWLSGAYRGMGDMEKENKRPAAALQFYGKAIQIIDRYYKGQRVREKAKLLVLSGQVLLPLKQLQKAGDHFNAALTLLIPGFLPHSDEDLPSPATLYGENTLMDALHGKADCLAFKGNKEKALEGYLLLFIVERKLRHEFFSNTAKRQQQRENRVWEESAMETAFDLWTGTGRKKFAGDILLIAELSKAQLLLDEMNASLQYNSSGKDDSLLARQQYLQQAVAYNERESALDTSAENHEGSNARVAKNEWLYQLSLVEKEVKKKYPSAMSNSITDSMPSPVSLLHDLPEGTAVTEFFAGQKNSYIIEIDGDAIRQIRRIDSASHLQDEVRNFVDHYFQQGPQPMMNDPRGFFLAAYAIYHSIWPEGMKEREYNLIIPDGIFGYLPFDALITDSSYQPDIGRWPYLLRKTDLYLGYSLQTWQQQQHTEHSNNSFAGFFISFDSIANAKLPAVKKEEEAISKAVKGDFFSDQKATLGAFNDRLDKVNLLHISTHSFMLGKDNIPVLQLADDRFFLFELYGKSFQPQLVVLSACRTGHGILAEGEGVISLARGFTATGAGGIVAGLWNMNDEAMAGLMGEFYHQLVIVQRPAIALYNAKLKYLQQNEQTVIRQLPYYWAGIVYSGDDRPVHLEKRRNNDRLWWLALILLAGGIFYSLKRLRLKQ